MATILQRFFDWARNKRELKRERDENETKLKENFRRINEDYTDETIRLMNEYFKELTAIGSTTGPLAEEIDRRYNHQANAALIRSEQRMQQEHRDHKRRTWLILQEYQRKINQT